MELHCIPKPHRRPLKLHVRPIWAQTGNDSLTTHDIFTEELNNQQMNYSVIEQYWHAL